MPSLLRRAFRTWLRQLAWPEEHADDLLIALNEAASNAVEHAYPDTNPGGHQERPVQVRARRVADPDGTYRGRLREVAAGCWSDPAAHHG